MSDIRLAIDDRTRERIACSTRWSIFRASADRPAVGFGVRKNDQRAARILRRWHGEVPHDGSGRTKVSLAGLGGARPE
jgi:hypothetical protein